MFKYEDSKHENHWEKIAGILGDYLEKASSEEEKFIKENRDVFFKLRESAYHCSEFFQVLTYLSDNNLLEQKSLLSCVKVIQSLPKQKPGPFDGFKIGILDLLKDLKHNKIKISKNDLDSFFNLKKSNVERMDKIICDLSGAHLLTADSLHEALRAITRKSPSVSKSTVTKESRKQTKAPRSKIILDGKDSIFYGHDQEDKIKGIVRIAYASSEANEPTFIIKATAERRFGDKGLDEAKRETKYNKTMKRYASYFFRKDRYFLVTECISGEMLSKYEKIKFIGVPFEKRMRCLISGLTELNALHANYRLHGDISNNNYMLDLENETMRLIDFGSTHKAGLGKTFKTTYAFDDPHHYGNSICRDLYAMGKVIESIFPEIVPIILRVFDETSKAI